MKASLDTNGSIDTAPSEVRGARALTILERLEALRPLAERMEPTTKPEDARLSAAAAVEEHASAWAEAVHIGNVRARRKAQGLDASVRAIATEVGCSRGHAGDCLRIRDAFNDTLLYFISDNGSQDDGHARLARLSFRTLRSLARLPTHLARIREARRLSNQSARQPRPAVG